MELSLIYNKYQIILQKKKVMKNKSTEVNLFLVMIKANNGINTVFSVSSSSATQPPSSLI
ncbi:hypothetical protein YC2023_095088 [Brassica napus]